VIGGFGYRREIVENEECEESQGSEEDDFAAEMHPEYGFERLVASGVSGK
jgi:hypothetical protein